ncbi:hypothetical protein PI125_g8816 [Phytophthora idaei]|nr:hypothetical protein PI125_g8816 [Phytophthora idaei]KAG3157439.1 hypothetical protein PI126_g8326 [Phytophthora idaei]
MVNVPAGWSDMDASVNDDSTTPSEPATTCSSLQGKVSNG